MSATDTQRRLLKLGGGLLATGFVLFAFITQLFHPHEDENNHPVIFDKYDHTDAWVIVHIGQFVAVLIALAGFVALHRALENRGRDALLARLAFGVTIATAAVWAILQGVDGTALKEATEAWAHASEADKAARFADAEIVRWTEWGLQSYFRLLMGITFILFSTALVRAQLVNRFVALAGITAGVLYASIGVAVGHTGLDKPGGPIVQLFMLLFVGGVLAAGFRTERSPRRTGAPVAA
jgi:hypothetical protein